MDNLKVLIIGAGMGGLTAGIALSQAGYEVEIYDRVAELRPAGAGISLWSNGVKVLNRLGLGSKMAAIGGIMNQMQYRTMGNAVLNDIDLAPLIQTVGQRPYPVARTDLQRMLLEVFPGPVHLGHECVALEQDETGVTAAFSNGHTARGDLLVAADGIRSRCRKYVLDTEVAPNYGGYVNWNGLVPYHPELAPKETWVIFVGNHQRASLMPVGGDRFYFFFDVPMPLEQAMQGGDIRSELTQFFTGWAEPVQQLIQHLDPAQTNRLLIHDVGPLATFVKGRVALLGDAAHATCPDLGQGGAQAMEDGFVLAQLLQTTNLSVEDALQRYQAERVGRTAAVVQKARSRAEKIHGKDPAATQAWYEQLETETPTAVTDAIAAVILDGPLR